MHRARKRLGATTAALVAAAALAGPATASAGMLDSLEGWWPMFEGRGQVVHDLSGHGNHGQLGSTPDADANDPTWIRGWLFGAALRFDGNDFVRVPESAALAPAHLTVSLWVRGTGTPGTYRYIVGKGADTCVTSSYALTTSYNGGLIFYIWDGDQQRHSGLVEPAAIWNGRWHHVAGTWDGRTSRLFLDGRLVPGGSSYNLPVDYELPTTGDAGIGGYLGTCDLFYTGDVDQVAVFGEALPIDQIWQRFAGLFPRPLR
jgi:Concanavalin A-like lectin/glucanases superfamily